MSSETELMVSLSLHNMPADLLREFAQKIVKPYFGGNVNEAIRQLMIEAIADEQILADHVRRDPL